MAIEDTFGYRFVRISLVLLNCFVLVRLISLLLQFSHVFDPALVVFFLLVGSNFMAAIIGAIREHRIAVLITGSLTLIMFLSLLFTNKGNKSLNVTLFTLLAIAAQSLIFSEMLKERQIFSQRQNLDIFAPMNTASTTRSRTAGTPLTAVVVYQPPGSNRGQSGGIFMVDPILGNELPKDPPPSYFAASCPPPKYEDAIKLNATTIVPTLQQQTQRPTISTNNSELSSSNNNNNDQPENNVSTTTTSNPQQTSLTTTTNTAAS